MNTSEQPESKIVIYTSDDGKVSLETKLDNDTLWLTQKQMAELFDKNVRTINEHINNLFKEGELEKTSVIRKFRITASDGKQYDTNFYNLDVVISVGYRVKSLRGTQFRIWATKVLKDYLVQGYALNEKRLAEKQEQIDSLKKSFDLLTRSITAQARTLNEAQNLAKVLQSFADGLDMLDDFDRKTLPVKGKTERSAVKIEKQEYLDVIATIRSEFASDVFANPKDDSFDSSINQIYQTFGGQDCYPTLEEKAAMLLYFLVKNHSFTDGNKRIGAACFLYFLDKNNILYDDNKVPVIDNAALSP